MGRMSRGLTASGYQFNSLTSASPRSGKFRKKLLLGFTGASALALASSAYAADQCGDPQVICSDPTLNPYPGGMSYAATSSFNLVVRSGTVVYRSGAGYDFDGVHVDGFGDGLLRLTAEPGVAIATDGLLADGIQVHSQARNDIEIVSGANIVALNSDGFSNGILGRIDDQSQPNQLSTSTASITIEQLAGSTVEVRGEYGAGVYGLHHGLGSVHIDAAGEVRASGLGSYGVVGYILNPEATGDIQINLASTGQVVTDGEGVIGLFAPHLGLGGSAITVAGRVETNLLNSDGAQVSLTNEANLSAATIDILEGGAITAWGPRSYAAWAYNQGQGLTRITHRGSTVASGTQSAGLRAEARGEARVIIAGSVAAPVSMASASRPRLPKTPPPSRSLPEPPSRAAGKPMRPAWGMRARRPRPASSSGHRTAPSPTPAPSRPRPTGRSPMRGAGTRRTAR